VIRVWVDTEKYPRDIYPGFRHLKFDDRVIRKYLGGNNWSTIHSNQTCMRNIEVTVLDEAVKKLI